MSGPFDVDKKTVAALDDLALRELVRRLLEAEARAHGIPPSSIEVGGAQTAPDGGIDALIRWADGPGPSDWLPRRHIAFQCKATKMAPSAIRTEMRPRGVMRPLFGDLAASAGAYIIVTTEDVGSAATTTRLDAMRAALNDLVGGHRVALDIYGADKLARWANNHVGVAMWLRERAGQELLGWRPFGAWSNGSGLPYLLDGEERVSVNGAADATIMQAIGSIRAVLTEPRGKARLVGISGMGKTRMAEALFDQAVEGNVALDPSFAVYGDAGLTLGTPPATVAERLAASAKRAVLIVDNCADRLHGQLAEIVSRPHSRTSLLTIDYELEGEKLEATLIVRLGDNSDATINNLIAQRFPQLGDLVRNRLTDFAGGNARIALAISRGVKTSDALTELDDIRLIDRLFQDERRAGRDATMRSAAEVAALVYAFHSETTERVAAEHGVLAAIAGVSDDAFYTAVERMLDCGIAQQRGSQRAIKPDALADRLAGLRLKHSDPALLVQTFSDGPPRLLASFARRIGRLHNVPKAVNSAVRFLDVDGLLGDLATHDDQARRAFVNIAPASPEAALTAIQRAADNPAFMATRNHHREYADTLAHIAWDAALFSRAMATLRRFALAEPPDDRDKLVRKLFLERFQAGLSFTMADGNARLSVIDALLDDPDGDTRDLALDALGVMLETQISSSFQTDFGTRHQHREWRWATEGECAAWFDGAYSRLEALSASDSIASSRARSIIASTARSNTRAGMGTRTLAAIRTVRPPSYWDSGWRAANDILRFDRTGLPDDIRSSFEELERELRPRTLVACFEAFVLGEPMRHWHPRGHDRLHVRDVKLLARGCGAAVAGSSQDISCWLCRATCAGYGLGPMAFGRGLGSRVADLDRLWSQAVAAFRTLARNQRRPYLLAGIIEAAFRRDRAWTEARLIEVATDADLAEHSVVLLPRDALDSNAVDRLIDGLTNGTLPAVEISELMFGGRSAGIAAEDLARLLDSLIDHPEGAIPALNVLFMRRSCDAQDNRHPSSEFDRVSRRLLVDVRVYKSDRQRNDHELAELARSLFPDEVLAQGVVLAIVAADRERRWNALDLHELKKLLIDHHLRVVLDALAYGDTHGHARNSLLDSRFADESNLDGVAGLDQSLILSWIAEDPQSRAIKLAALVPYAVSMDHGVSLSWFPLALAIVDAAPDPIVVLDGFERRFYTGVSTGPFYLRFERRLPLVDAFLRHQNPALRKWARETRAKLEASIKHSQDRERSDDSLFE